MAEVNKLNIDALEDVIGGAVRTVHNDSVEYANVREQPGLNSEIIAKVYNGTKLKTTGRKVTKDGYTWYQVMLVTGSDYGWISGSLIGY